MTTKIKTINPIPILRQGGVGILATDTLYGLVGSALSEKTVERLYYLRKRQSEKPFIILVSKLTDLALFDIKLSSDTRRILSTLWPGKISIVLPCASPQFHYLHRGTQTLAFRIPKSQQFRSFLNKTGPLVAPSANPVGKKPAQTIQEAYAYFGATIDFYHSGKTSKQASTVAKLEPDGHLTILRSGPVKIPRKLLG